MRHGRTQNKIAGMVSLMVIGVASVLYFRPELPLLNLVPRPAPADAVDAAVRTQTVSASFQPGHATSARVEVYAILSTECPISNAYLPELNRLASSYATSGVRWFGVFPAAHLTDAEIERFRAQYQVTFPLLLDRQQRLVSQLQATHTPQVIVMDGLRRFYSGRIDNRYHAEYLLPTDTIVFDATPHMHTLGREIKAVAYLPDGTTQPLPGTITSFCTNTPWTTLPACGSSTHRTVRSGTQALRHNRSGDCHSRLRGNDGRRH